MKYRWKRKKKSTHICTYGPEKKGVKETLWKAISGSLQGHLNRGLLPQEQTYETLMATT